MKQLHKRIALVLICVLMLGMAGLAWSVRREPIARSAVYVDALASFWILAILLGVALRVWLWPETKLHWAYIAIASLSIVGCVVAWPIVFACVLLLLFFLENECWWHMQRGWRCVSWGAFRAQWESMTALVAIFAALVLLTLGGARRFDAVNAGAALNSMVFWLTLGGVALTTKIGSGASHYDQQSKIQSAKLKTQNFKNYSAVILGLYLMARLYTLGPWLPDWSLATLTLGIMLLLWNVLADQPVEGTMMSLALLALGLGTSAGIAAACFALLAMLLSAGQLHTPVGVLQAPSAAALWILPFSMSFVAFWSLIAAVLASGMSILAGGVWLGMLVLTLHSALQMQHYVELRITYVSMGLALFSPLLYSLLIPPVVEQLQGGLTPYGTLTSWPWLGLAAANAGNRGVMALPIIGLAALLIVLMSALYLLSGGRASGEWASGRGVWGWRVWQSVSILRDEFGSAVRAWDIGEHQEKKAELIVAPESQPNTFLSTIIALGDEVPWLSVGRRKRGSHEPR